MFRKINKIDYESFHSDILSSDLIKKPEKDLSALCQQYDSVLSSILDKHAPVNTKTMPRKPPTPWMTPEIIKAKTLRHNLERTWRRSRTHLDHSRYKQQCHLCNRMMTKAKSKYLADVIAGVSAWMTGSKLKLNPSKTEFLLIGTKLQREIFLNKFPCLLLGQETNTSTSAKNLGVLFDSSLNFRKHISQTCRTCLSYP